MNDDDLMTEVRDRFAPVRMHASPEQIMARGRSLRRRRHGTSLAAGALAVSLGAGLSVTALTAGPAAPAAQHATLAAWTVDQHPDGSIGVTIRRPQDLKALQARLAKLGAPVLFVVVPAGQLGHGCAPTVLDLKPAIAFQALKHAVSFEIRPLKMPPHSVLRIALAIGAVEAAGAKHPLALPSPPAGLARAQVCRLSVPALKAAAAAGANAIAKANAKPKASGS